MTAQEYKAAKDTLMAMKETINHMHVLIVNHEVGEGDLVGVKVIYTDTHKTDIITKYNELKATLASLYQAIP